MSNQFTINSFNSFDDLLNASYRYIIDNGNMVNGKRGKIKEVCDFIVRLNNPRSRVSSSLDRRLVRSKFAEFAWYLSKEAEKSFIEPYIAVYNQEETENNRILGGYGPKIFGNSCGRESQIKRICNQINTRKDSKQAFLVISDPDDYYLRVEKYFSPPCTIGLHFLVRDNKLNLTTYMRSNDAYLGLPHDLFCFTMLQEMVALRTNISLGTYTHICTSLHIYEHNIKNVLSYLDEGHQETLFMPKMTQFDDEIIKTIVHCFDGQVEKVNLEILDPYWNDYALFANRFVELFTIKEWLRKFQTAEIKEIANSSVSK